MKALCFDRFGGPEVLYFGDVAEPLAGPADVVLRTCAIGLNFADIYRRRGNYHLQGRPPFIAGYEAAGEVVIAPPGSGLQVGDRVAIADVPFANAARVAAPVTHIIRLPDDIGYETAAAVLLQGLTAQYLVADSHRLQAGETVLVHAAAGGVGLLLVQIARMLGARVLGVVSSPAKADAVRHCGGQAVMAHDDWVAAARAFGAGAGVDVVYDSVGSTLQGSLEAVRRGGHVVFYGMAGGDPAPVDPRHLMDGSKSLTGGDLWNVLTSGAERQRRADQLFDWLRSGAVEARIAARFALSDGARAHAFLEGRGAVGKVLLIP